jgi:hypothetical protein
MDLVKLESEMSEKERDEALEERCLGKIGATKSDIERLASISAEDKLGDGDTLWESPDGSQRIVLTDFAKGKSIHAESRFERCGPCTSECYANCKGWMPSGEEIRDKMAEVESDLRKLD